ncbi:MAG: hypothetical protein M3Q07_22580, partial [Pseudobdellovibrionaceae bacterium]|nr:hypothetical protein [Pseudobdellovibrionaceae bacterium]
INLFIGIEAPIKVAGLSGIVQLASGSMHACALRADGRVFCWGVNGQGQLGLPAASFPRADNPTINPGPVRYKYLTAGYNMTCGISYSGAILCWGDNSLGQFGNGTTVSNHLPQRTLLGEQPIALSAGRYSVAAVMQDGTVKVWGDSSTLLSARRPTTVPGLHNVKVVNANFIMCAINHSGEAFCWGNTYSGRVGMEINPITGEERPAKVEGLTEPIESIGGSSRTCAISKSQNVYCLSLFSEPASPVLIGTL